MHYASSTLDIITQMHHHAFWEKRMKLSEIPCTRLPHLTNGPATPFYRHQ
jgi:hypothetical protein